MRCEGTTRKELIWPASRPSAAPALTIYELTGLAVQQVTGSNKLGILFSFLSHLANKLKFIHRLYDKPGASWRRARRVALKGRLESNLLLTPGTMLFILETKGGPRKSSPATTHSRPHSSWPESSKIPARTTPKKSQWRRARSQGHSVTWRIFFFSRVTVRNSVKAVAAWHCVQKDPRVASN